MGFHEEISAFERIVIRHLHLSVGVCVSLANEYSFDLCPAVCVAVCVAGLTIFPFQTVHCYHVAQIMKNLSCTSVKLSDFLCVSACVCILLILLMEPGQNEAHRLAQIW